MKTSTTLSKLRTADDSDGESGGRILVGGHCSVDFMGYPTDEPARVHHVKPRLKPCTVELLRDKEK